MIGSTHSPILVTWNCFLSSESIFEFFEKTSNRPKAGPGPVFRFFEFCFLRWIHLINWWYLHESDDWSNVFQLTRADFGLNFSIFNKKAFYISACQHFHFLKPAQGRPWAGPGPALGRFQNQPENRPRAGPGPVFKKWYFFENAKKYFFQHILCSFWLSNFIFHIILHLRL